MHTSDLDAELRTMYGDMPAPDFPTTAFVTPPPLARATVAIVTTAALQRRDEPGWEPPSWTEWGAIASFRTFAREERDLIVGHPSMNFDRTAVAADLNVVYPIDRLEELACERTIGAVAPRHLSFIGTTDRFETLRLDTGPAAARMLLGDGVDVVLLTPV